MQSTQPLTGNQSFGKFRNFLWPIHGYEHKKLLPMLALFFLISFVYNLLRCLKLTVVVTAKGSGAEVIPFLKVWAVLPTAVLLTYLYTKLSNRLTREQVFFTMIGLFLSFFTIFLLVLHPHREALELTQFSDFLQTVLPDGLKGMTVVIRHWPLSLFYVISEMWSAIMLTMLFWGFANEVTSVDEAKRFYAIFALSANFSGIFSSQSAQLLKVEQFNPYIPFGETAWDQTLALQLGSVLLIGLVIIALFHYVSQAALKRSIVSAESVPSNSSSGSNALAGSEEEKKLSLKECFAYLIKSPYMLYITILVVAYNIVYNLADVLWTYQVNRCYPDANEFNSYINNVAFIIGIFSTLSGLILSGNVIRRYGWTVTAMITPAIWFVASLGFFGCMLFEVNSFISEGLFAALNIPMISLSSLTLFFGSAQICLGRAAKYTVFDETKEIAFIPLPKSEQRKGKAVVDGIASRFGKSGGSLSIQVLLLLCGELVLTIPYIAAILFLVMTLWFIAVRRLGKLVSRAIDTAPRAQQQQRESPSVNAEAIKV